MGTLTNAGETIMLDSIFGKSSTELSTGSGAGGAPSTWVLGLIESTAGITNETWLNTDTGECAGSTYARIKVANSSANFTNSTAGGTKTNKTVFTFTASAGSDWGVVNRVFGMDTTSTSAGGTVVWYSTFAPQTISAGNTVQFATGSIVLSAS
jgi:hypothetical protein